MSGAYASSRPTSPKGVSTVAKPGLAAIDEPAIERVVTAGRPRAAASSRCRNARKDQCSTSTSPARYALENQGLGVKFGKTSPEYPVTTFVTRPPRKKSEPRLDRLSITRVNCGSRPHQERTR